MAEVKLVELTKSLSSSLSMSEERSGRFVDALVESTKGALAASKDVSLPGFGTLSLASADDKPIPSMYKANLLGDICAKLSEANESRV
ncbi:MAG TPA: HU family DNA-binding protein, partial [Planctomycetota bacterium]|nr:HU family DNA-binding protein [Planctomycetota bacterium]